MTALDGDTFEAAVSQLASRDRYLAAALERCGVPAFWHRPPGFATLALFIVEQQVSLASAKAVFERLLDALGEIHPSRVLAASDDHLGQAGLTRQKQRYLRALARAVQDGDLDLPGLAGLSDETAHRELRAVPGIGRWTADVYLLSALRRPDVWPSGDRALQVGVGEILGRPTPTAEEVESIGQRWAPHRSVAARVVWHSYLCRRNRTETEVAGLSPVHGEGPAAD